MADLKAQFRAAKEQRGGASTKSLAQIKALKAQQKQKSAQGAPPNTSGAGPPAAVAQQTPVPVPASRPSGQGVPDEFFEQPAKRQAVPATAPPSHPPAPAAPSSKQADASLPAGFFADKAADAKARGVKLPNAKDKEDEFQAFQRMMEEELKVAAVKEAEEAEEEAGDKEDREMFEQRLRMQRLHKLVMVPPKNRPPGPGSSQDHSNQGQGEDTAMDVMDIAEEALGLPGKEDHPQPFAMPRKKRVIDTMRELGTAPGQEDAGGGIEEEDSVSEEELLDWRAKGV